MEQLLTEFINTLDLSVKKSQEAMEDQFGITKLTFNQLQYVNAIYELMEPTITEIANKLNITKASVTAGINKLVNLGYVVKTQSGEDRRVFHVSLTEAGEQLIKAKFKVIKEYSEFILASLSEEETNQFKDILTKLVRLYK
ncbi:MAG: MarR family transcriptional regulator [Clostridia bacterium]|nr:MarR family transcriptional regulator [Clostridia bacterium]